jgi:serine/threonine protein kinase
MIGTTLSHFKITAKLGEGGMGEVYRAEDTKLGREVAIKVLPEAVASDPERLARFEREAKVLASLNHPNIGAIYGLEEADDKRFLVLELIDGETLQELIEQGVAPENALEMAAQVASALEVAHEQGVVHRDLKPANIKITPNGTVKVLDFGLAKALDPQDSGSTSHALSMSPTLTAQMTQAGVLMGTAAYMSPEQARGQEADKRADIWAFGVVLWEMLTRQQLFAGDTVSDTLAEVLKSEPDLTLLPDTTPPSVIHLLRRCLTRDSQERLRDIGEARIAIRTFLTDGEEALAPATGSPADPGPPTWKRAVPWIAFALAGLAATGFGLVYFKRPPTPMPLVNASVVMPEGVLLIPSGFTAGPVVVSPDGTRLAFSAIDEEGNQKLWHRSLDQSIGSPLPGTEGAIRPFWSPDSQHLGFFAGSQLKRISVLGGPPISLTDVNDTRGGTWGLGGTIVYAPNLTGPLMGIPEGGGEPEQVTQLDTERSEQTHRYPHFLPDGRHVLFLARSTSGGAGIDPGVFAVDIVTGERKRVLDIATNAAYASGHLLYMRESTLIAQPFDIDRLEITGDPYPIVENALFDSGFSMGTFSASSNGVLAFHPGGLINMAASIVWMDREGNTIEVVAEPATYQSIRLSPDGGTASISIEDTKTGAADLWLLDLDRGVKTRFTFSSSTDDGLDTGNAAWSPDGRTIAYSDNRSGSFDVYKKAVSGTATEELIASDARDLWAYDWSSDGEWLCYGRSEVEGEQLLGLKMRGDSTEPIELRAGAFNAWPCTFSPDNRWLAYTSDESGLREVFVTSFPDLEGKWQISSAGGDYAQWRADGKEIFYLSPSGEMKAAVVESSEDGFRVGQETTLFSYRPFLTGDFTFDVSADGNRFLVLQPEDSLGSTRVSLVLNWTEKLASR